MKKLIYAHFLGDTLKFFILMCLSVGLIIWVIQAVSFLDFVTEDGHSLYVYFLYTLFNLPKIILRVLPFIFFISLFYQINKYELKNELLIFWTIGVKKSQFIKKIILFSLLFLIFQVILGAYITPMSQDKARSYIRNSNIDFFPSLLQEGKFIDTVKNLTIFIMSEETPGIYKNIFLKEVFVRGEQSINFEKSKIVSAKKGFLKIANKKKYLELHDGKIINKDGSKINNFSFKKIDFDLMQYASKTTTYPKIQELNSHLLIKCLFYNFKNIETTFKSEYMSCNKKITKSIKEEILKRFYKPIYLPLLALISSLIIYITKENKKFLYYKSLLFLFGILIIIISEISVRYSSHSLLGMGFFIFIPLIFFFSIFIYSTKEQN
ncbi:LptF/LptG family permease [Candidatus Pelagibacter sp.]|nr:LptF/LptG family permease [Candidatus Pelagibacter sp.]